jgi:hypothetical protein
VPLIDDWLPHFDVGERHDVALPVEPERALELALAAPAAPDRLVRALLATRGFSAGRLTIDDFFHAHDFDLIGRSPTEWAASLTRGSLRIAIDFRAERIPGGSRLTTETRVKAAGDRARRAFRAYWLVIGPFSALIRRRWLREIQRRAR